MENKKNTTIIHSKRRGIKVKKNFLLSIEASEYLDTINDMSLSDYVNNLILEDKKKREKKSNK